MSQQQNELVQIEVEVPESDGDDIDLLGLLQTLGEEKWLLFGLPFFCACVAAVISLYLTPTYTAKATFIVPEKQSSSTSIFVDQIAGGGGLGALTGGLGKSTLEMYISLMQSNYVLDTIITELNLRQRYETKTQEETRKKLLQLVKITAEKKSGILSVEAKDQSPDIAAKLANAYLKPFRSVLNRMSVEEAHKRRDFFAQQLEVISQRPFRDPSLQANLLSSIIRQYETARLDEAREAQLLFQVDIAQSPERRESPKRAQLVLIVGAVAFLLILLWIFIKRALRQSMSNPASSQKWVMLKKAWKLSSSKN
jgi:capsular polysaccharide biosynthesis protein